MKKYNYTTKTLNLNRDNEEDLRILEYLNTKRKVSDYLRELVLNDMKKETPVIKEIKNRRPIKLYDKYFTGGGSTDFKEYIRKINCEILDNNLFTNVNGNLIIAEEKWRRE